MQQQTMTFRLVLGALALPMLCSAQAADKGIALPQNEARSFSTEKKLALVVCVDSYPEESDLSRLKWAAKDATDLAAELTKQGYVTDLLVNQRVTKVAVRRHLADMLKRLDPGAGTVIFAFSGHGGQVGRESYLAMSESSAEDLDQSGLAVREIRTTLEDSSAPRKIMFLDACRTVTTPGAKDSTSPIEPMAELASSRGLRMLVSTGPKTRSFEYDDLQHGLFTYYLLRGLKGAAVRPDGLITFGTLAHYVTVSVKERNPNQEPYTDGQASGEFALAGSYHAPAPSSSSNPGEIRGANAAMTLDPASEAWNLIKDSRNPADFDRFAAAFASSPLAAAARFRADQLRSAAAPPTGLAVAPNAIPAPLPADSKASAAVALDPRPVIEHLKQKDAMLQDALAGYSWRRRIKIVELNPDGSTAGQYTEATDFVPAGGTHVSQVVEAPVNTLRNLRLTPLDLADLPMVTALVMTPNEAQAYDFQYVGKETLDEVKTFVFDISPTRQAAGERRFKGRIWVDDRDYQIVKTLGKAVGKDLKGNQVPDYEGYRELIDGRLWYPTYGRSDETLHFANGESHRVQVTVRYTDYKKSAN